MNHNISTRFRHISSPHPLTEIIHKETQRLEGRHPRILGFMINVDKPHRKHQKGNQVRVQMVVSLPKKRIFITKEAEGMAESENATIALNHAFDAADHAVDQYLKRKQGSSVHSLAFIPAMFDNFGVQSN